MGEVIQPELEEVTLFESFIGFLQHLIGCRAGDCDTDLTDPGAEKLDSSCQHGELGSSRLYSRRYVQVTVSARLVRWKEANAASIVCPVTGLLDVRGRRLELFFCTVLGR